MQPQERTYRPLLPAESLSASPGANGDPSLRQIAIESDLQSRSKRGTNQRWACDSCRTRKIACDGQHPVCTACRRQGKSECLYYTPEGRSLPDEGTLSYIDELKIENQELRERLQDAERLINLLRPNREFLSLNGAGHRGYDDRLAMASRGSGGSPAPGLAPRDEVQEQIDRGIVPPTQSSFEFELMARHPVSYPTLVPVEAAHIQLKMLFKPELALSERLRRSDRYLDHIRAAAMRNKLISQYLSATGNRDVPGDDHESILAGSLRRRAPIDEIPSHKLDSATGSSLCDERLGHIVISTWTKVPVTNEFAARAISLYLETDHPLLGLFDADLFLDDLVSGQINFCSPLLVNALLCWACQAYSYIQPESGGLARLFYVEANELWHQNKVHTLTAVAASVLLSVATSCLGDAAHSKEFLVAGSTMGKSLGLFGVPEDGSAKTWLDHHHDWVRSASHTAWGVFNITTFQGLHFHTVYIESPPRLPRPGDGRTNDAVHSEPNLNAPTSHSKLPEFHPLPAYMGPTFTALCGLWSIAHDLTREYYDDEDVTTPILKARLETAEGFFHRLLAWADELPLGLVRGDQTTHHATLAHIYYHAIILDIFRPFMQTTERHTRLGGFVSESATPDTVYKASVQQLLRLTLVYLLRFPSSRYTFLWHTALLYVANAMLSRETAAGEANCRIWFQLCMEGYRSIAPSFPIVEGIVQGLLSMAMRARVVSPREAEETIQQLRTGMLSGPTEIIKGGLMVDLDQSMRSPLTSQLGQLANQFDELLLFDEFL